MIEKIIVYKCECEKCNHKWVTRTGNPPKVCPNCKRKSWNASGAEKTGRHTLTLPELPATLNPMAHPFQSPPSEEEGLDDELTIEYEPEYEPIREPY